MVARSGSQRPHGCLTRLHRQPSRRVAGYERAGARGLLVTLAFLGEFVQPRVPRTVRHGTEPMARRALEAMGCRECQAAASARRRGHRSRAFAGGGRRPPGHAAGLPANHRRVWSARHRRDMGEARALAGASRPDAFHVVRRYRAGRPEDHAAREVPVRLLCPCSSRVAPAPRHGRARISEGGMSGCTSRGMPRRSRPRGHACSGALAPHPVATSRTTRPPSSSMPRLPGQNGPHAFTCWLCVPLRPLRG